MSPENASLLASLRALPLQRRDPTALETYLETRLRLGFGDNEFLDALRYYEVAQLCEWLGAWATWGRDVPTGWRTEANLHVCSSTGFAIAVEGAASVAAFLDRHVKQYPRTETAGRGWVPSFGQELIRSIHARLNEDDHLVLRSLLLRCALANDLLRSSVERTLDMDVPKTGRTNILGAASALKVHYGRLKRVLLELGIVPEEDRHCAAGAIFIDVEQHRAVLDNIAHSRNKAEAAIYLGVPVEVVAYLHTGELLVPFVNRASADSKPLVRFTNSTLDRFLSDLLTTGNSGAVAVQLRASGKHATPMAAGMKVGRPPIEVFRLIVTGALRNSIVVSHERRIDSLLVDVDEVRHLVRRETPTTKLSAREAAKSLGVPLGTVRSLLRHGFMERTNGHNPVNLRDQYFVTQEVLSRFRRAYIPGTLLRASYKCAHRRLPLTPAFDQVLVGAQLFSRSDVASSKIGELAALADIEWPTG